ncbi:putative uncharacterized protein [Eggerthella sp. CAG:209]|nr:putative uncharacterized protein [Eggerthella sp. CAG:209]
MSSDEYMPRIADDLLAAKLRQAGAVVIRGPKWCGKTETALKHSKSALFMQDPDQRMSNQMLAESKPSILLRGEKPRLIDEWQEAPQLWDAVRFSVDREREIGLYILTGSATSKEKPRHSGAGRMSFLDMRTMSLYESRESTGEVSLLALFDAPEDIEGVSNGDVETIAFQVARGGWPSAVTMTDQSAAMETAHNYLTAVAEEDISNVDGVSRNPDHARLVMRSFARCVGSQMAVSSMSKMVNARGSEMSRPTFSAYLGALRNLSIIEDLNAWEPSLRAKARISRTPKRYFADPSLAAAALGASPDTLLKDMPTLGMLYEALCIRDLRVYAQKNHGQVFFYRDNVGLEADAVVALRDGRWGLVEIKLNQSQADAASDSLRHVANKVDQTIMGAPSFLLVVTADGYAYRRNDGVYVVPIGCLKP